MFKKQNEREEKKTTKEKFKKRFDEVEPILKNKTGIPAYVNVLAGVAIAPAVPVAFASAVVDSTLDIAGGLINDAGFLLAAPTTLLSTGLFSAAVETDSKFKKFVFAGTGAVVFLPTLAVSIATAIPVGAIKFTQSILNLATKAVCLPFKMVAKSILAKGEKIKNLDEELNKIYMDECSQM